jgi:hypothetical protein
VKLFKKPKSKFCWFDFTVRGRRGRYARPDHISRFAMQHLRKRVVTDCGLDCVLHIRDVDLVTCIRVPISFALASRSLQIIAIDLGGEFAFHSANGLFHLSSMGRENPQNSVENFEHHSI